MVTTWPRDKAGAGKSSGISTEMLDAALAEHVNTLRAFAHVLQQIAESELIRTDPYAQRIISSVAICSTPMEADELMDKLLVRVGELIAARTGDNSELHHLMALTGARRRMPMNIYANRSVDSDAGDDILPSRTFMKL